MDYHSTLNMVIEISGLLLQAAIIALLLVRRQVGRFPAFTLIMVFFVLRSLLFYSAGHYPDLLKSLSPEQWTRLITGFSIAATALQAAVVTELVWWLLPALSAWQQRSWWKLSLGAVVAICFAGIMLVQLGYWPGTLAMGHGGGMMMLSNAGVLMFALTAELLVLSALAAVATVTVAQGLATKLALGWGIYGSISLIGQAVQRYAMQNSNSDLAMRMQYLRVLAYVLMLLLWMAALVFFAEPKPQPATAEIPPEHEPGAGL